MNLIYLETFVNVVKSKNISVTANSLYISQPAVTKQIRALENYYNAKLFYRENKEMKLTEEGLAIYEFAINTLNYNEKLKSDFIENDVNVRGNFNIICSNIPAYYYLPNVINKYLKKYPNTIPSIELNDSDEVLKRVSNGCESFGFVGKKTKVNNVEYIEVFQEEMVLVGNAKFIKKDFDLNSLNKKKFIIREEGSSTLNSLKNYLNSFDLSLTNDNTYLTCQDNEIIKNTLLNSDALAYLPKCSVYNELENGSLIYLVSTETKKFYYVYNTNRYMSNQELSFHRFIKDYKFKYNK